MSFFATKEGTEKFFHLHSVHKDKKRKLADLSLSALSISPLMGESGKKLDKEHLHAILSSVEGGVNVIDVPGAFHRVSGEKMIQKALEELKEKGIAREQLFLISKVGYLPYEEEKEGEDKLVKNSYLEKKIVYPGEVVEDFHCISPSFIHHQIRETLENLGVEGVDLFFLHNPEVQLEEKKEGEFETILEKAFEALEEAVSQKKIRFYGISSWNGFRKKRDSKGFLDLSNLVLIAKKIAGENHHFKAIQTPINLIMLEALKQKNQKTQEEEESFLWEACKELGISLFASSPFMEGKVFRLPSSVFAKMNRDSSSALQALQFIGSSPEVVSVLTGMKDPLHIHENLHFMQKKALSTEEWNETLKNLS